jgi:ABC-type Fe3+ transport system permease subunit
VPVAVPGVVAGVGCLLALGGAPAAIPGVLLLAAVVVGWELPAPLGLARAGLAGSDRSPEEAAASLGADRLTALRRIVAPALRPLAGRILGHAFAAGVLALGTVVVLAGAGLGSTRMLALAVAGAPGAACAVATVLLALAGGALLLGRALAGRERDSTPLA